MLILYALFWISLTLIIYPYTIYPLLLFIFAKISSGDKDSTSDSGEMPHVTLIISAYNEEDVIERKLINSVELNYPPEKLEIIAVSDASTDGTDELIKKYAARYSNINLMRQDNRMGKTSGLNRAVRGAVGDIIVFSDANSIYDKDAIAELIKYFSRPDVGYVMGAALYNVDKNSAAAESEGLYWKFELFLKEWESKFHSVVGGDGAIYAIRKELYWDLEEDDINDFVNPLQIVAKGFRGIFNPRAICYEDAAGDFKKEFQRKRRIVNRSWRGLKKYFGWFRIGEHYKFLFELFSHKVIRWISLPILAVTFISNLLIVVTNPHPLFVLTLAGQICFAALGLLGRFLRQSKRDIPNAIYFPYYYLMAHIAALLGIIDEWRGIKHITWEHVREA